MRTAARLTVALLSLSTLVAPAGLGSDAQAELDLSETIAAGDFRAHRVRLLEAAQIEVGGVYEQPVQTTQPVLPILALLQTDSGAGGGAIFTYDFGMFNQPVAASILLKNPTLGDQLLGNYVTNNVQGGGWFTTSPLPPGEYTLITITSPANGSALAKMRVLGAAELIASQGGRSFFDRGIDHSTDAYDVHLWARPGLYARAWEYSGADLPLDIAGKLYGYVGYHTGQAHYLAPDGTTYFDFVPGAPGGAWQVKFPAEQYQGPVCAPGLGCAFFGFGDTREDPPFAIAADISV